MRKKRNTSFQKITKTKISFLIFFLEIMENEISLDLGNIIFNFDRTGVIGFSQFASETMTYLVDFAIAKNVRKEKKEKTINKGKEKTKRKQKRRAKMKYEGKQWNFSHYFVQLLEKKEEKAPTASLELAKPAPSMKLHLKGKYHLRQ